MSVIGYREWEIWKNDTFFERNVTLPGQYTLHITPALMAEQTIEFLSEVTESVRTLQSSISSLVASAYVSPHAFRQEKMVICKVGEFDTSSDVKSEISTILDELRVLSICVDFPLTCHRIEFVIPPVQPDSGKVFIAARRPIARAVAFEVEERGKAAQNLSLHFDTYNDPGKTDVRDASEHYLNGLTLLGLEDQSLGLLEAAFMQFYQGCEVMCGYTYQIKAANKHIAAQPQFSDPAASKDMQVRVAHVWRVRNTYFAHRGQLRLLSSADVYQVVKQVFVARWLCRALIDSMAGVTDSLCREMRFYHAGSSEEFRGSVAELETSFRIPGATNEKADIFDSSGAPLPKYVFK